MITVRLTDQELDDIAEARDDPEFPDRAKSRLLTIVMHHEGVPNHSICEIQRTSASTLTRYLKIYKAGGIAALAESRYYRPSSSLEPFWQCLVCSFKVEPVATAKEAVYRIQCLTGITLSESQAARITKKMGMAPRKCMPVPGKADHQLQFEFYVTELQPRLQKASRGERKVFSADAAHFVLGAVLGMIWCFKRVFLKTPSGRQRYNVLGAVDSHTKEFISVRSTENTDAGTVSELFYEIRRRHPDTPITVVMDNARYQRCDFALRAAADFDIEVLFLPSYSPNLNLIERLWKLVKKRALANQYFDCFAKFTAAIDGCLDAINAELKDEVESLLTLNFQFFNKSQT